MKTETKWKCVWRDSQWDGEGQHYGLSLWSNQNGRLALKDMSGPTPDTTEDGPLYLAFARTVTVDTAPLGMSCSIPVTDETGRHEWFTYMLSADAASFLLKLRDLGMPPLKVKFTTNATKAIQGLLALVAAGMND